MSDLFITRPEKMAELIWRSQQTGGDWHLPLFRAAKAGELNIAMVPPGGRIALRHLDPSRNRFPLVVLLCGDAGLPIGPADFPQSGRLLRWARFIVLHGAGGEASHYDRAVEAARIVGRVLIVECQGDALPAWVAAKLDAAPQTPGLVWKVPPGQPTHPVYQAPAGTVFQ